MLYVIASHRESPNKSGRRRIANTERASLHFMFRLSSLASASTMKLTPPVIDYCRRQFPALSRRVGERPVAFFDGPGGTQVPQRVIEAVSHYLAHTNANHGGHFATSRESD